MGQRRFVVQKHAATSLHYDFRLELASVLKSWSVPKGPSLDPDVRRLAMYTEDHPLEYADFEGVIPRSEYGGGSVMIWDRGTWAPLDANPHQAFRAGKLRFELHGAKLAGIFTLVRKRGDRGGDERVWLLSKGDDSHARRGPAAEIVTARPESAATGRTIEEIGSARDRVWHSNRGARRPGVVVAGAKRAPAPRRIRVAEPVSAHVVQKGDEWLHEVELQGDRVLVRVDAGRVRIEDAAAPHEDRTGALRPVVEAIEATRVLDAIFDGVIVAGGPTFLAFDLLRLDGYDLRGAALEARKSALEKVLEGAGPEPHVRFVWHAVGGGESYLAKACELGARGVVSKRRDAAYGTAKAWRVVRCAPAARAQARRGPSVASVAISNASRVMYPEVGLTKLDVAQYYETIARWIVPQLRGRPLTLVRCGMGLTSGDMRADCTFMKHGRVWGPKQLRRVRVPEKTKIGEYLVADDVAGVVGLVQMDVLEIHTWNATTEHLEEPDRLVFDLDPGPQVPWPRVVSAARTVRDQLRDLGLRSWVKTTGGAGLHVVVPLAPSSAWEECLAFSRAVSRLLEHDDPCTFTTSIAKAGRTRKIYVDYLRNSRGNTSVAAYSTRARPSASVSVPVTWDELDALAGPDCFRVASVLERLSKLERARSDPWEDYVTARQRLTRRVPGGHVA